MIVSYRMDGDYPDPAWTDEGRFRAECLFMAPSGHAGAAYDVCC